MLESVFEIRGLVREIHYAVVEEDDGEEEEETAPEERAALERISEDLGPRLLEMIERYRKLNAEKRAEGQT